MNRLFKSALKFLDDNEPLWGITLNRRAYLKGLLGKMSDKTLAKQYRKELAGLTDEQLKNIPKEP